MWRLVLGVVLVPVVVFFMVVVMVGLLLSVKWVGGEWERRSKLRHIPFCPILVSGGWSLTEWFEGHRIIGGGGHVSRMHRTWELQDAAASDIFLFWGLLRQPRVVVFDLDAVKDIMRKTSQWHKTPLSKKILGGILGEQGMLFTEGEVHKRQKRVVSPSFHQNAMSQTYEIFIEVSTRLVQRWMDLLENQSEREIDLVDEMADGSLQVICISAFGMSQAYLATVGKDVDSAFRAVFRPREQGPREVLISLVLGALFPPSILSILPIKALKDRQKAAKLIRRCVSEVIDARKSGSSESVSVRDLLESMLSSVVPEDERNGKPFLTESEVVDQCMNFMGAGQITTAFLMTWTLLRLATHRRCWDRIKGELRAEFPEGIRSAHDVARLDQLPYLDATVKESLRLHPPVTSTTRLAVTDVTVGKYQIPKGTIAFIPMHAIQLQKKLWDDDAHLFRPERWLEDAMKSRNPYCFLPFLYGDRACLGSRFATVEAKVFIAQIMIRDLQIKLKAGSEYRAYGLLQQVEGPHVVLTKSCKSESYHTITHETFSLHKEDDVST
eukprot:CAMPEP_0184684834 /NCGR_PEP_ID=MMETSP0312-20130426/16856_1 /TAXON_ID=31354 /ORGANISM="Compsopogon coeruleus, Strain SAG 36.94" /LENGTH=552 /DNA_ID=CAMNT_0027138421 /DNA_START=36 /DNA_END=1694 /DNA_ORIENTATION=+